MLICWGKFANLEVTFLEKRGTPNRFQKKEEGVISTVFFCVYGTRILRHLSSNFDDTFFLKGGTSIVIPLKFEPSPFRVANMGMNPGYWCSGIFSVLVLNRRHVYFLFFFIYFSFCIRFLRQLTFFCEISKYVAIKLFF